MNYRDIITTNLGNGEGRRRPRGGGMRAAVGGELACRGSPKGEIEKKYRKYPKKQKRPLPSPADATVGAGPRQPETQPAP